MIADSFGRPWRIGQTDVAIGCAGLTAVDDWRGRRDGHGTELAATAIAVADEVAAAADLVRAKDEGVPVTIVRGLGRFVTVDDGPGAAALRRPRRGRPVQVRPSGLSPPCGSGWPSSVNSGGS